MLTRILAYVVIFLGITQALTGWWLDHDERDLGAVPAQIQSARLQDADAATKATLAAVAVRVQQDQTDRDTAVASQAKADHQHELTMLGIQQRQDAVQYHFEEASHDKAAMAWAALPVPSDYYLGLCVITANCPDQSPAAAGGVIAAQGTGSGPGADSDHVSAADAHGQPRGDHQAPSQSPGHLQRR